MLQAWAAEARSETGPRLPSAVSEPQARAAQSERKSAPKVARRPAGRRQERVAAPSPSSGLGSSQTTPIFRAAAGAAGTVCSTIVVDIGGRYLRAGRATSPRPSLVIPSSAQLQIDEPRLGAWLLSLRERRDTLFAGAHDRLRRAEFPADLGHLVGGRVALGNDWASPIAGGWVSDWDAYAMVLGRALAETGGGNRQPPTRAVLVEATRCRETGSSAPSAGLLPRWALQRARQCALCFETTSTVNKVQHVDSAAASAAAFGHDCCGVLEGTHGGTVASIVERGRLVAGSVHSTQAGGAMVDSVLAAELLGDARRGADLNRFREGLPWTAPAGWAGRFAEPDDHIPWDTAESASKRADRPVQIWRLPDGAVLRVRGDSLQRAWLSTVRPPSPSLDLSVESSLPPTLPPSSGGSGARARLTMTVVDVKSPASIVSIAAGLGAAMQHRPDIRSVLVTGGLAAGDLLPRIMVGRGLRSRRHRVILDSPSCPPVDGRPLTWTQRSDAPGSRVSVGTASFSGAVAITAAGGSLASRIVRRSTFEEVGEGGLAAILAADAGTLPVT